ncbi:asparagine synthase (glutamine-hydrolyzing) [uncultured Paenibacillus sp.]|uniref:asparagine synthase (glutamine-hydrolyzing) n=1 Tax=uncultured Paenibacillus sp. TaxID=227322 RepID=UPI0015AD48F3|nr:asparagine synthase (glutamine-hydrolyzing) [uncultured Paenibacillus sp.]
MCGILFANNFVNVDTREFKYALKLMEHRGPDAPLGFYGNENIMMGHNRLSIVDLYDRSNQPLFSDDRRYAIIFNGEIYNYKELSKKYNIKMRTNSDTELLLKLYIKFGATMLNWLNGMFAFIILDTEKRKYFVARDRLGVKPLYYHAVGDNYIFSSEIPPILHLIKKYTLDDVAIRQYKKMRNFFNNRTIYHEIKEFPPGFYMEGNVLHRYWKNDYSEKQAPSDEELKFLIETSVNYRKVADVKIGSYLSGGLDSTIITGLTGEQHTWTVGFRDMNEFYWSQLAANHFNTEHHSIEMDSINFFDLSKKLILRKKELLSVPNEVLLYFMTSQVKKENTVVMSGEGADELFFGYDRIFKWANNTKKWNIEEFCALYTYGSQQDFEIVEDAIQPFLEWGEPEKIVAAFFQEAHLRGLLKRLDNATMLNSVEARSPFLDYRLVERLSGVSYEYKTKDGIVKAPLKRVFKDIIPIEIIERKKVGFPVPLEQIFDETFEGDSYFDKWFNFNLKILGETL